ncbi:glutaredoxin [Thalassotalea sp. M1531]|uniref:Glutaredoxin n=1 Tax=Thalassotalea algicola TaxID=2716224 RepID=A0A7Y0LB60_9GAMM|nr:glutaredoxin [Thalassotalea algicola]NMP30912.1 glutaredoxin [Thalassotalea algicola]
MAIIRWFVGQIILFINFLTFPKSPSLSAEQQAQMAEKLKQLSLYQLPACPFCVKVRRAMKREGIELPIRNIQDKQHNYRDELIQGGGKATVPCLKIETADNDVEWLYESSDIINYLKAKVAN